MGKPTVAMLTFGDGALRMRRAARRLARQAMATGWFCEVQQWDAHRLRKELPVFAKTHARALAPGTRGFGYWIWKPAIIAHMLRTTDADVVLYLDAGCVLNATPASAVRMERYVKRSITAGVLATRLQHPEYRYTKRDLFDRLVVAEADRSSGQAQAGIGFWARQKASINLADDWLEVAVEQGYRLVDDSPSVARNHDEFIEHRHDQSIFSCLAKQRSCDLMPDETYFPDAWATEGADFPIWAARHLWGSPFPADGVPGARLQLERLLLR